MNPKNTVAKSLLLLAVLVVPLMLNLFGFAFYLDLATRLSILAIAAVGLNLILGYGGMVSFGHAAYLGIGAYAVGIPAHHWLYGGMDMIASTNGFLQIALALFASALFAFLTGLVCLKVKGVYFIMITMAFAQMLYYLLVSISEYGGDDGLVIDTRSEFPLISLDDPVQMFLVSVLSLFLIMWGVRRIARSQFGMVLEGIKGNEARMISLGYNTFRYKLAAYVISGVICGFAGALLGNFTTFISPEMIDWARSGELMFMVILGGVATTMGPLLGAITFIVVEEVLSTITVYWHLPFGLMLIGIVLFVRGDYPHCWRGGKKQMTELLSIKGLNKSYGGVKATDDLNLSIREGELHAIIGPNGAGKTTLISQLSGNVMPDSGTVHFAGRDITRMSEHQRPHLGMSRTYQITSLIRSMSVLDNLQLAIQAQAGHSFRFWSDVRKRQTVRDRAGSFAKEVGLEDQLHARVDNLAHGEQRRLEVAMALTSNSRLLLLDEPLAGLGGQEAAEMIDLLQSLKGQKTMLLIEHDMDAVFTLADRISVLVYGHIIATDQPEQIRLNVEVQQAYLGEG